MKNRIIALLMVIVMLVFCFASCGKKNKKNEGNKDNTEGTSSIYPWSSAEILICLSEDSDSDQLPSSSRRYLAGELSAEEANDYSRVDDYVTDRNKDAEAVTGVKAKYFPLADGAGYGWGQNIQYIYSRCTGGDPTAPDVFVNFVYDMVAASLKGSFANLYSTTMYGPNHEWSSTEYNYFAFEDNRSYMDTGKDYMYDYMTSLTLSVSKMYCLSSDYFVDMVRAFFVVPVNIGMLESLIPVSSESGQFNSDRNGDGKYTIDDFYKLVWDYEWNYETLASMANQVTLQTGTVDGIGLDDRIGFALATGTGLPASGMLYTTSITIVKKEFKGSDWEYSYPNIEKVNGEYVLKEDSEDTTYDELGDFCTNLTKLVREDGVIAITPEDASAANYANESEAIRRKFANDTLLFGGVIVLGGLEHEDYMSMKAEGKKGYGIVPVPLYHSEGGDEYLTQIHNNGKIGAISYGTQKFAQCTAFLNYQSLNSNKVLNEYYTQKLRQTVKVSGTDENAAMLTYIRKHVRSSFDKAFEDALGAHFNAQTDGRSDASKWHNMIKTYKFELEDMRSLYAEYATTKAQWLNDLETKVYPELPA